MDCKTALQTVLDSVDYTSGNCRPNEMVGAVLPREMIVMARQAIADEKEQEEMSDRIRKGTQKEYYTVVIPSREVDFAIWGFSFFSVMMCEKYASEKMPLNADYSIALVIDP